ncbi:hypothetical protein ABZX30_36385 [Streptomyces sp. NPDC004542]|uniref:hypothetical protein n=1 Tax=Streptomyces sp. NPDC004542 TaxID=3154281 RepID=UPI0033A8DAB6
MSEPENHDERPRTALEEVLHETARAESRPTDPARGDENRGEAADAITPSTWAQEESRGE